MSNEMGIEASAFEYGPEGKLEMSKKNLRARIEQAQNLLVLEKNKIGEGTTAEVHFLGENEQICMKIISASPEMSTLHKEGQSVLWFNSLPIEADITEDARRIGNKEVRIPRQFYTVQGSVTTTTENTENFDFSLLAMERLDAVTIDDILSKEHLEFPKGFNPESFFRKLRKFIEEMHERGIYHRDLKEDNIMVDTEGNPCVIDFGRAAYSDRDSAYTQQVPVQIGGARRFEMLRFIPDEDRIDRVERSVNNYLQWKRDLTK